MESECQLSQVESLVSELVSHLARCLNPVNKDLRVVVVQLVDIGDVPVRATRTRTASRCRADQGEREGSHI